MEHVYKQFFKYKPISEMSGLQWFALTPAYGKEYGDVHVKYEFKRQPKLLDIGDGRIREMIEQKISGFVGDVHDILNPDEQYSGGPANKRYHTLVMKYFGDDYDGTIIDSANLKDGDKYTVDDLEGASEVVIWKDFDNILREVHKGGKKKTKKKKKKKKKKNRTKKLL